MSIRLPAAVTVAVLLPAMAAAQSRRVYVQAGPLLDGLTSPRPESVTTELLTSAGGSVTYRWNDLNGDRRWQPGEEEAVAGVTYAETRTSAQARFAPGASIGVGVVVRPSISVGIEGAFHGARVLTSETTPQIVEPSVTTRQAVTFTDLLISAGWHQGESRKVALTYLAGVVLRRHREETTSTLTQMFGRVPLGPSVTNEYSATLYRGGAMAGIDATVNVSPRLAIVPQLRMVAANGDWSLRPAITMRWRP
jgi:hypothetical protein